MTRERFIYPWLEKQVVLCPKCQGRIEMLPLLPTEINGNKSVWEHSICHKIDAELFVFGLEML